VKLDDLANTSGEWLRGSGPEADIVISSRIRLARNVADFPFISRASPQDREQIEQRVREALQGVEHSGELLYLDVEQLGEVDRQFLVERHLISREHAEGEGSRAVAIDSRETFSVMVNEEDHLRIQVMHSGLDLEGVWEQINRIDDAIEEKVTYRSLHKINLAVRGLHGEGSQAMGDFYQISNQVTLGRSEPELIQQVREVVPVIIDYERQAREFLVRESHQNLHDRVSRAYGILRNARTISSEETLHLLSSVRMGVNLGLIRGLGIPAINELFIRTQPAHLQKLTGGELSRTDRDIERARYLRRYLNKEDDEAEQN